MEDRLLRWVEPSIVAGFEAPAFDAAHVRTTLEHAGRSAQEHQRFLERWNGCYALNGALHLFGARADLPNQSLDRWNAPDGWRQSFGMLVETCWFFAENAFGDQFAYRDNKVWRLRVIDARFEPMATSFSEWLEATLLDPARWLSLDLFDACVRRLGPLPFGGHFGVPPTWAAPTPLRAELFDVLPARDNLELRAAASIFSATATRPGGFRPR
jgi:hypothetical protein